jgi:hypothetical protein
MSIHVQSYKIIFMVYILLHFTGRSSSKVRIKMAEKCKGCGKITPIGLWGTDHEPTKLWNKVGGRVSGEGPVGLTMGELMR